MATYLYKTLGTPTGTTKNTLSLWVKIAGLGTNRSPIFANSNAGGVHFRIDDAIDFYNAGGSLRTSRVFRDISGWYHILAVTDTTLSTADDRLKVYVNGVQETSFSNRSNPSQNATSSLGSATEHIIGANNTPTNYFNGYMSHVAMVDGQALAPTVFGQTDSTSGIWKFKSPSGVTWGDNGFHLKFENSGNLGLDSSGESNTFTANANGRQVLDTPSNVSATLNPLAVFLNTSSHTYSNGNNTVATNGSGNDSNPSSATFGITTGKWYWETKFVSLASGTAYALTGIMAKAPATNGNYLGGYDDTYGYAGWNGTVYNNSGSTGNTSGLATYTTGDILGIALDLDNNRLYFYKNGAIQNSGTGIVIPAAADTEFGAWFPAVGDWGNTSHVWSCNFGNGYFGTTAITSAGSNGNGSLFEYDCPSGYYALNTKNINTYG